MLLFNQNLFYVKIYDLQLENKVVKWSKMLFTQMEDIIMVTKILLIFAVLAALDRIFGNKLKLGEEFEKGIMGAPRFAVSTSFHTVCRYNAVFERPSY